MRCKTVVGMVAPGRDIASTDCNSSNTKQPTAHTNVETPNRIRVTCRGTCKLKKKRRKKRETRKKKFPYLVDRGVRAVGNRVVRGAQDRERRKRCRRQQHQRSLAVSRSLEAYCVRAP